MANVRLDANGVPKGPVYECQTPILHRSGVTQADASDPADASGAVDSDGYRCCRFDVELTGTVTEATVQVLFWNGTAAKWFGGASYQFTAGGRYALAIADARGAKLYLKVKSLSGTNPSLTAHAVLS